MHQRDAAWFDALFAEHSRAVFRYFVRRAPRSDADDLTADVFTTAWRRRQQITADLELAWLYRTAGFVLANHRRKGRPIPLASVPEQIDDTDSAQWAESADDIREVMRQLSAKDRQVLLLTAWDGLSGDQLAVVLGVSRGGADAALSRARARLREAWCKVQRVGDISRSEEP